MSQMHPPPPQLSEAAVLRGLQRVAPVLHAGFALGSLVGAVAAAATGRYALAPLLVGVAVFWAAAAVMTARSSSLAPRWTVDAAGTRLRYARTGEWFGPVMMLGLAGLGVGYAAVAFWDPASLGFVANDLGDGDVGVLRFSAAAIALSTSAIAAVYLYRFAQRGGGGYLLFTPEEFVFATGFADKRGRWSAVRDIRDTPPVRVVGPARLPLDSWYASGLCPLTMVLADGSTRYVQDIRGHIGYDVDPAVLRDWVRIYWEHPLYRRELVTGGALRRLNDMVHAARYRPPPPSQRR